VSARVRAVLRARGFPAEVARRCQGMPPQDGLSPARVPERDRAPVPALAWELEWEPAAAPAATAGRWAAVPVGNEAVRIFRNRAR
jgi:hypothetical protein